MDVTGLLWYWRKLKNVMIQGSSEVFFRWFLSRFVGHLFTIYTCSERINHTEWNQHVSHVFVLRLDWVMTLRISVNWTYIHLMWCFHLSFNSKKKPETSPLGGFFLLASSCTNSIYRPYSAFSLMVKMSSGVTSSITEEQSEHLIPHLAL